MGLDGVVWISNFVSDSDCQLPLVCFLILILTNQAGQNEKSKIVSFARHDTSLGYECDSAGGGGPLTRPVATGVFGG